MSESMLLQRYVTFQEAALATKHEVFGIIQGVRHHLGRYLGSVVSVENGSVPPGLEDFSMGETERQMHAQRIASKTTSITRFADLPLVPKHELMLRCHYASVKPSGGLADRQPVRRSARRRPNDPTVPHANSPRCRRGERRWHSDLEMGDPVAPRAARRTPSWGGG